MIALTDCSIVYPVDIGSDHRERECLAMLFECSAVLVVVVVVGVVVFVVAVAALATNGEGRQRGKK